jgi:hypothetical protein
LKGEFILKFNRKIAWANRWTPPRLLGFAKAGGVGQEGNEG